MQFRRHGIERRRLVASHRHVRRPRPRVDQAPSKSSSQTSRSRCTQHKARGGAGPVASRCVAGMQISPAGSKAHQSVRSDRDQMQSSMQAIELDARRTKGSVSHAAGSHRVSRLGTRFMVRMWWRSQLRASIERPRTGGAGLALISFWTKSAPPPRDAHVKCWAAGTTTVTCRP